MIEVMRAGNGWFGYTVEGCVMERGPNHRGWHTHRASTIKQGDVCLVFDEVPYNYQSIRDGRVRAGPSGKEVMVFDSNGTICVVAGVDKKVFGKELV